MAELENHEKGLHADINALATPEIRNVSFEYDVY